MLERIRVHHADHGDRLPELRGLAIDRHRPVAIAGLEGRDTGLDTHNRICSPFLEILGPLAIDTLDDVSFVHWMVWLTL